MSTILQDMMGMLSRKKVKKLKQDDYFVISRYETPHERLKPNPKVDTELILAKDLVSFINNNTSKLVELEPFNLLAGNGGSSTMPTNYNLIDISWDGLGSGNYILNLPPASSLQYRNIRRKNAIEKYNPWDFQTQQAPYGVEGGGGLVNI